MTNKTLAPHITAVVSAIGAVVTLLHPGFTVPPFVQGWVTTVCAIIGGGMELVHTVKHHNLKAALAYATQMAAVSAPTTK